MNVLSTGNIHMFFHFRAIIRVFQNKSRSTNSNIEFNHNNRTSEPFASQYHVKQFLLPFHTGSRHPSRSQKRTLNELYTYLLDRIFIQESHQSNHPTEPFSPIHSPIGAPSYRFDGFQPNPQAPEISHQFPSVGTLIGPPTVRMTGNAGNCEGKGVAMRSAWLPGFMGASG